MNTTQTTVQMIDSLTASERREFVAWAKAVVAKHPDMPRPVGVHAVRMWLESRR